MNKKRKSAYAAMTTVVLSLIAIIILNLIVTVLSSKVNLKIDLTSGQILDFSDTTNEVISSLDMDVEIISLIPESDITREILQIKEILQKYDASSERISLRSVDTSKNPTILSQYEVNGQPLTSEYNIIFESERMYTVVSVYDIVGEGLFRYKNSDSLISGVLSGEQHFTSALVKVTRGSEINAYVCTGHGEAFDSVTFKDYILPGLGYTFSDINLKTDSLPDDADIVIIASPATDYALDEIDKLDRFLSSGGSVQVMFDCYTTGVNNLMAYLEEWNIDVGFGVVCDNNSKNYTRGNRRYIIPEIPENDVTEGLGLGNVQLVIPDSRPVSGSAGNDIALSEVLCTSDEGFIKQNIESEVNAPEAQDEHVKSAVAVMASKLTADGERANLFVTGTTKFLGEYNTENSKYAGIIEGTGNRKFYSGIMAYMTHQPASFYIMPKNTVLDQVVISQKAIYLYAFATIILIPVILLAFGFVVWTKRRHL